jgi:hypothetical protein
MEGFLFIKRDYFGSQLFETEDVLHVVEADGLALEPAGCADGSRGEGHAGRRFVGEFDTFTISGKKHGVVADDVAATEGVHADFTGFARPDVTEAAVGDVVLIGGVGFLVEDF